MERSPRRRRLAQLGVAALLVAPTPLLLAAAGSAASELGNYNGTVSATALHVQAGSSAFPNYASGAVDNHYPLAAARLDSSPFANAVASPLDTGPAGQTAAGTGSQSQPQYSDTRCPPQCDDKPVTVGAEPGPFASAQTTDHKALAAARSGGATFGGGGGGAPAPPAVPPKSAEAAGATGAPAVLATSPAPDAVSPAPAATDAGGPVASSRLFPALDAGRMAALRAALIDWRARYLTADDARRYPMPAADTPDGMSGDTARSEARLDGSALVLDGTSSVGELVLGGGALVLRDVNVKVSVTNDGTPKKTVVIDIGSALVGGTPVTIGAGGVSVNGQAVPGIGEAGAQAGAALNQALAQAGIEVRSLAPSQQLSDHQLTLDAVGVSIRFSPASPAPGVPANFMALAVGEVFADALAVPGEAAGGELDDGLPGDLGAGPVTSPSDTGADTGRAGTADASLAYGDSTAAPADSGSPASASSGGSGAGYAGGSGSGSSGAALGTTGSSPSARSTGRLASPAAARRLVGRDKPTELLLLYLLWQSLVIGTVASLYLWRKAAA